MNESDIDAFSTEEYKFAILGVHLTLCIIKVVLNSLVLFIIARSRELHRPTGLVLANTSLSYLLIGVASLLAFLPGWFPVIGCGTYYQVCSYAFIVARFSSSFSITMLNIDRLVAIVKPFSYTTLITPRRIWVASTVSWLMSLVMTVTIFQLTLLDTTADIFGCRNVFIANYRFCFYGPSLLAICTVVASYGYIIYLRNTLIPVVRQKVFSTTVSRDKLFPVRRRFVPFIMIMTYLAFNLPVTTVWAISDRTSAVDGEQLNRLIELAFKVVDNLAHIINLFIFTSTSRTFRNSTLRIFFRSLYRKRLVAQIMPSLHHQQVAKNMALNNTKMWSTDRSVHWKKSASQLVRKKALNTKVGSKDLSVTTKTSASRLVTN